MRHRTKTIIAAVGITGLAVVGMDAYTYAGTGDSLLLGKINKANKTTHVTITGKGPALSLHAKGNRPALAVDSKAKIVRLNADRVDGKHASGLQNNVRVYTKTSGDSNSAGGILFQLPKFPKGRYQANYEVMMDGVSGTVTNPTSAYCELYTSTDGDYTFTGYTSTTSVQGQGRLGLGGSAVINKSAANWRLSCKADQEGVGPDDWSISPGRPVRVTLTRVDKTIGGKLAILERTRPNGHRLER